MLGQCCAGNYTFISTLLKGLFLNNGDVPGFENSYGRGGVDRRK